jgi:hypothetical protein
MTQLALGAVLKTSAGDFAPLLQWRRRNARPMLPMESELEQSFLETLERIAMLLELQLQEMRRANEINENSVRLLTNH